MPRDSGGAYSLPAGYLAVTGETILASQHNSPLQDIATALTGSVPRNGTAGMLANLPMGGFKATGMADGVASTDSATVGQTSGLVTTILAASPAITTPAITGATTISGTAAGTLLTLTSTDAGATAAPAQDFYRNSASPAASDLIGYVSYSGQNSTPAKVTYSDNFATILDPTAGSEDSTYTVRTKIAGAVNAFTFGAGFYMPGATGGDKGAGTVNTKGVYVDGARLGGAPDAVMEDQKTSGTGGGTPVASTWTTHALTTEVRDPSGLITISSNQFTPTVAGWVEWEVIVYSTQLGTRLQNITDGTTVGQGTTARADSGPATGGTSIGGGAVVAGKAYAIQYYASSANANGLGLALSQGTEVYARVKFWRA